MMIEFGLMGDSQRFIIWGNRTSQSDPVIFGLSQSSRRTKCFWYFGFVFVFFLIVTCEGFSDIGNRTQYHFCFL